MLSATDGHPFWDVSTGLFTEAIDLEVGELVLALDGQSLQVASVRVYGEDLVAYSLEIEGIHTYFAGETPVLVHNSCGPAPDLPGPPSLRHTPDEEALHALASEVKKTEVDADDAATLTDWASELGWDNHGIQLHPGRPGFGGQVPHFNIGDVKHIPWTGR